MVKIVSSIFVLAGIAAVYGAAIGKKTNETETPGISLYANEGAIVEGSYSTKVFVLATTSVSCKLKQNEKIIFNALCQASDYSQLKCRKCESNNNLKLCVDQNGCYLYDSNGHQFWSSDFGIIRTNVIKCPGTIKGPGCMEHKASFSKGVRI